MPIDNEKDLAEVPENIRKDMKIHFVEWMDQVLRIALVGDVDALADQVEAPVQAVDVNPGVAADEGRAH